MKTHLKALFFTILLFVTFIGIVTIIVLYPLEFWGTVFSIIIFAFFYMIVYAMFDKFN